MNVVCQRLYNVMKSCYFFMISKWSEMQKGPSKELSNSCHREWTDLGVFVRERRFTTLSPPKRLLFHFFPGFPTKQNLLKWLVSPRPLPLADRITVVRAQYFVSELWFGWFAPIFHSSVHPYAHSCLCWWRGWGLVHFHALHFWLSHVTCFGQWHISRCDRGLVLSLDLKGICMFLVALLAPLTSSRTCSG